MNAVDLRHLRYKLCAVLPALRSTNERIPAPPPTVIASCIIIGHTTRREVEHLLGEPWRPKNGSALRVAHYVYPPTASRDTLASLFLEYDEHGIVRALSAGTTFEEVSGDDTPVPA